MEQAMVLQERIKKDKEVCEKWQQLTRKAQRELLEMDAGIRVPNFLNDTIFKRIFDPDEYGERLSRFISAVLGKKIQVLHSLKNEGRHHSIHSKGVILDLVVRFANGSIGNVEIQRFGIDFPSKRAACYSADLVTRQYASGKDEKKSEIDYDWIQPVYTIIIFEKSPANFAGSGAYHHHFEQRSDTGVKLELLQYYDYVCLDAFKRDKPHVAGDLEKWLKFLTITEMHAMQDFLREEPSFQDVYDCAIMMTRDRKELMELMSDFFEREDIIASLNKTNESKVKRLQRELEELKAEKERELEDLRETKEREMDELRETKEREMDELREAKEAELEMKDLQLKQQEKQLEELERKLEDISRKP